MLISVAAAALMVSSCADYDEYGYDYGYGPYVAANVDNYDGYYDGFYGPFDNGYWGGDGVFVYEGPRHHWHRDEGHHFRHEAMNGFRHVRGHGGPHERFGERDDHHG